MNEFDAAAERWNAEHPLREQTHGTCPVCSGRDCFNVSRGAGGEARWTCFNARHNATGGGRQATDGEPRWFGDALDLEAHATGRTRAQILRDAGVLSGDPAPRAPRPVERSSEPPTPMPMEVPLPAPVAGLDAWSLSGSRLRSKNDRRGGESFTLGWRELLRWFNAPSALADLDEKKRLPCWTAGVYTGGAHPHDTSEGAELAAASALVFDLDAKDEPRPPKPTEEALLKYYRERGERLPPEKVQRLMGTVLPGVAWAAHPTASSSPALWRWRVLIPLAEPLPGGAYQAVVDALRLRFLASEAPLALEADATHNRKPMGLSFAPAVLPERRADYGALSAEGGLLAWREILDGAAKRANLSAAEDFPQLAEALKRRCEYEQRETVAALADAAERLAPWSVRAVLESMLEERTESEYIAPLPGGTYPSTSAMACPAKHLEPDVMGGRPGWPGLRSVLGGWRPDTVAVLVGHTGRGKSSWAVQVAEEAARSGAPVLYASLEMNAEELLARMLAMRGRVGAVWANVKRGRYPRDAVQAAGERLAMDAPHLYLWAPRGSGERNVDALERMTRAVCTAAGGRPPLVVLDYVQRLADPTADERRGAVSELSARLRDLSRPERSLRWPGCAVVALSSVGRAHYEKFNSCETLRAATDLEGTGKESGEIEYDAPIVLALTSDPPKEEASGSRLALLRVVKNREGRPGDVWWHFEAPRGVFSETDAPPRKGDSTGSKEKSPTRTAGIRPERSC